MERGYDRLSTYGILPGVRRRHVYGWIAQLAAQGYLESSVGDQGILRVTEKGWQVLKGNETPRLARPESRRKRSRGGEKPPPPDDPWESVDRDLFEMLRATRRTIADEKMVPAFVVFSDATLRDMARRKPATPEDFLEVTGVGETKRRQYGERFLAAIREYGKA
jgi:ATP-dependent DNA helicase RecQ